MSQDKIALVGYSMGAWVINKWIVDHPLELDIIRRPRADSQAMTAAPAWDGDVQDAVAVVEAVQHGDVTGLAMVLAHGDPYSIPVTLGAHGRTAGRGPAGAGDLPAVTAGSSVTDHPLPMWQGING